MHTSFSSFSFAKNTSDHIRILVWSVILKIWRLISNYTLTKPFLCAAVVLSYIIVLSNYSSRIPDILPHGALCRSCGWISGVSDFLCIMSEAALPEVPSGIAGWDTSDILALSDMSECVKLTSCTDIPALGGDTAVCGYYWEAGGSKGKEACVFMCHCAHRIIESDAQKEGTSVQESRNRPMSRVQEVQPVLEHCECVHACFVSGQHGLCFSSPSCRHLVWAPWEDFMSLCDFCSSSFGPDACWEALWTPTGDSEKPFLLWGLWQWPKCMWEGLQTTRIYPTELSLGTQFMPPRLCLNPKCLQSYQRCWNHGRVQKGPWGGRDGVLNTCS